MFGYIYIVENTINNKKYVGKKTGKFDKNYYGSGIIVRQAIKKYGKDKFSVKILENCDSPDSLNQREKYFIEKLKPIYNISAGGDGGHVLKYADKEYVKEIYERQSEAMKNTWKNLSSDERKAWGENISKSRKGSNGRIGTHHSEETKKKISESNKGKHSDNNRQRKIAQIDTISNEIINIFTSVTEAAISINPDKFKSFCVTVLYNTVL
jgi:group I intron endonuclease